MELALSRECRSEVASPEAAPPDAKPLPSPSPVKRKRKSMRTTRPQLLLREELDKRLAARQYMDRLAADIQRDLGGKDQLSTVELSLVEAFVASTVTMSAMSAKLALGETIDFSVLSSTIGAMVRVASRLGLQKRSRDVTPSLDEYLQSVAENGAAAESVNGGTS